MNDPKAVDTLLEGQLELLTTDDICTLMRVSQGTVLRWMRSRTDRSRIGSVTASLPGEAVTRPAGPAITEWPRLTLSTSSAGLT
jgi:hypothetical protein